MANTSAGNYSDRNKRFEYDVFLSFRGPDTRTFVGHLFNALDRTGFRVFLDNKRLEYGKDIQQNLHEAIDRSEVSVVILSRGYANSRWCLDELVDIMELRALEIPRVLPVFFDVEPTLVRNQTGHYKDAFSKLKKRFKAEKIQNWKSALTRVASLRGLSLNPDRDESLLVDNITQELGKLVNNIRLDVPPYIVGRDSIIDEVNMWLKDGSPDVEVGLIFGLGGIGKSTVAKIAYNDSKDLFERCSFLQDFTLKTTLSDGLSCLLEQVILDVTGKPGNKIYNVDKGINEVRALLCCRKVLLVLDDVDKLEYLPEAFSDEQFFGPGTKIIITTRNKALRNVKLFKRLFEVSPLHFKESKELLNECAFIKDPLSQRQEELLNEFTEHCRGLPQAYIVMGPLLRDDQTEEEWENLLKDLKACRYPKIFDVFKLSYDRLEEKCTKDLFLYIACFFVGMDKEYSIKILEGCGLLISQIKNLVNRCLLTIDYDGKLMMHQSIEEMGKEIAHQEAINHPERCKIVWSTKDSKRALLNDKGTFIRGLRLYLPKLDNHTSSKPWPMRFYLGLDVLIPWRKVSTLNLMSMKTSSFTKMSDLELLLLTHVQLEGGFEDFPKEIKWLLWLGCPLQAIPSNFNLGELVVLDMQKSCLVHAWHASKYMGALRVLNLSYSRHLVCTPDLSCALKLECLFLKGCVSLVEVHESIGTLINLAHLNLKGCTSLAKMHTSIETLEKLTILNLAGCKSLASFPIPKNVQELNLAECSSFFMACNRTESSVICLSNPSTIISFTSSLLQYPVPSPSDPFLPFNLYLPALKVLNLRGCGISRVDVMGLLSCAPSLEILDLSRNPIHVFNYTDMRSTLKLKYVRQLSLEGCGISGEDVLGLLLSCAPSLENLILNDNPIRALSNTDMRANLKLYNIILSKCTDLQSISWLPRHCHVFAWHCSSLKTVSYISGSDLITSNITTHGCHELVEVDYGCSTDRHVINWIDELDESEANQLGFPNLVDIEDGSNRNGRRGFYRAGTYQFYLLGDHLAKLFTETATVAELHFTVPSNELDIRALNLGFMILDKRYYSTSHDVTIKNLTSKWKWKLYIPFGEWVEMLGDGYELITWASHWRTVKEHREIKPGDLLHISLDASRYFDLTWGIKIIYEDQQQQVDEDASEQHDADNVRHTDNLWSDKSSRRQTMNHIDKTTTSSIVGKRVDQEEEEDVSTSVSNRYNNIFCSSLDLSVYECKRHSDNDEEEDRGAPLAVAGRTYPTGSTWSLSLCVDNSKGQPFLEEDLEDLDYETRVYNIPFDI